MISRLVHTADFRRLLATTPRSRSAHFALHHVDGAPAPPAGRGAKPRTADLSTGLEQTRADPVDNLLVPEPVQGLWLGIVAPKRHARRAVTRSLIKRQALNAALRHAAALGAGLWLVRLRVGYPAAQFPSASSKALRIAVQAELDTLFGRATR